MLIPCGHMHALQLNRLLARGDEELELFAAEDEKLKKAELSSWKALSSKQASRTGPATAALNAGQLVFLGNRGTGATSIS
jgi:hypothetical protein